MKWWILIITVVVLLLAGGGAAAYLFLSASDGEAETTAGAEEIGDDSADTVEKPLKPALYQAIEPPIIVNFQKDNGGIRYLQVGIEVMSRDQQVLDVIKNNMPAIRNDLIFLLSEQEPEDLHSRESKEALRESVRAAIGEVVKTEASQLVHKDDSQADSDDADMEQASGPAIEAVYFTKFVMQ